MTTKTDMSAWESIPCKYVDIGDTIYFHDGYSRRQGLVVGLGRAKTTPINFYTKNKKKILIKADRYDDTAVRGYNLKGNVWRLKSTQMT